MNFIRNKNCLLYYNTLRSIFPSVGYKEGKFLRDLKDQIIEYSLVKPNCSYTDVEKVFGNAEDVVFEYISSQGCKVIHKKVQKNKIKKRILIFFISLSLMGFIFYTIFLCASYKKYSDSMPETKETIIYEGSIQR